MCKRGTYQGELAHAIKWARRQYATWAVVEIDHEDDRIVTSMPLEGTEYDEFVAFDGEVLTIVEPDGFVDRVREHDYDVN